MIGIKIKPVSVNEVWQGKRFKTKKYQEYEQELLYLLPNLEIPNADLCINLEWGFSSKASDIDNPVKPFLDVLQKKYGFDDKQIYELNIKKKICNKGAEYVMFNIETYVVQ
jgi:Holliday junction resolvase RusA-like endonuclease